MLNPAMFSTARSTTTNSSSPRAPQDTQRKYAESLPFRVARAPVVASLPFTTTSQANPDYYSDDRRNSDWTSAYYDSSGHYAAIPDDRARTPRHFVDSDRGVNRKPMPDFPIFARLPNEQFIYDRSSSEFYSSDYDDFSGTTITPSSYSLIASDELSFSTPESDLSSDQSEDYTPPSTPRDSRSQMSMPPMPSQHLSSYPTLFRDLPDVGYSAPHLTLPETDFAHSFRSGSDGNIDPRRESAPDPSRAGSAAPASPGAGSEHPDGESVMSIESEDTVHRLARINAKYNAAASALYGAFQRDPAFRQHSSTPSIIPAVQRIPTPATTPTEAKSFSLFTDAPLSSSPTQLSYPDDLSRPDIYRDNALPIRRSSSNNANISTPIYLPSSYVSSTTSTSMRPSRNQFLPPRKEWDYSFVPPTPGNSPQSPHASPADYYRPPSHAPPERTHGRPLPVPPSLARRPSTRDGAPATVEVSVAQYSWEMPNAAPTSAQDGRPRRTGEADQPAARRDQPSARPSQPPSATASQQPLPDESQKDRSRSSLKHSSSSKDRHRSGGSGDASRAAESTSAESPTHGPRFIAPTDSRKSTSRPEPVSATRHTTDDPGSSRQGRSSRDNSDHSDRRESRSEKQDRGYDSSRDDKSKSSRHAQDRDHHTSRPERSSRSSATATNERPQDHGRRRKDSLTQRAAPSSIPMPDIVLSPRLVPIVRAVPRPEELTRSYSRGGQPTTMVPQEVQVIYQRPIRRHSDDDRPGGGNGRSNGRDPATASGRPPTEPHRRFSDSDAPPLPPPFLPSGASSRAPPQPGPMRTRANSISRTVRWNDNLVCPSPSAVPPKRDGWFNRRGDQLWTNDGLYMPCPAGQEYPPDLEDYPEYGEGWMNERCVRIDMGHRLIPKAPLRPALKQPNHTK